MQIGTGMEARRIPSAAYAGTCKYRSVDVILILGSETYGMGHEDRVTVLLQLSAEIQAEVSLFIWRA